MKSIIAIVALTALTGCANFQGNLKTITNDVVAVNDAIRQVSASLAANCDTLHSAGLAFADLGGVLTTNTKAQGTLSAINAVLATWCSAPPQDIAGAIRVTAAEINAAKAAYKSAQAGN